MAKNNMLSMKSILSLLTFCFLTSNLFSQFGGGKCPEKILKERFLKSTVLVFPTGSEEMDEKLKLGFERYWKLTDYKFVEEGGEFSQKDETISYIIPITRSMEGSTIEFTEYAVVVGGEEKLYNRVVAVATLDDFGHEGKFVEASYRATSLVKILHDYIELKINTGNTFREGNDQVHRYAVSGHYNKRSSEIAKKTLLVSESAISIGKYSLLSDEGYSFDKSEFEKLYAYKVEFVSDEELHEAIDNNSEGYCYLVPVYSFKKHLFVIDCETESILYSDVDPQSLKMNKKDIKELNKAIQ